ncbi:hypothetical protein RND81_09G178500 [Saponaria officinalis]|uniref:Coenzyme Q-binding protein COQ10 START domain-containing protein n=1 Tax=Saponaria officinalis TaxID=3572 RepID=A0AAW1IP31_SAPOF
MPQFLTTLRAIGRSRLLGKHAISPFTRCLSSIAGIHHYSSSTIRSRNRNYIQNNIRVWGDVDKFQKRWFLGCGDGEEGSALSKLHEERLVIGYSPEQLYAVVEAVDLYEDFLPWCQRSEILRRYPDGSLDAELEIGFKFLIESYVSHVVLDKPKMIKTTSSESTLFEHLINVWEFSPGPTPDTCSVYFLVDFKFRSPLYRQVASMFFKEVVSRLVSSFIDRCRLIYGPEATIQQRA